MESSRVVIWLLVVLSLIFTCDCQTSTMVMNVAEMKNNDSFTFACNISSSQNLTRWTFQNTTLPGSTKKALMGFQNNVCTVSPNDSFMSNIPVFSHSCNSTVYQVNIYYSASFTSSIHNNILACRDALELEGRGSTWFILIHQETTCKYCKPTMTFNVQDVTEGDNVTFIYRVLSNVTYVNWKFGSNAVAMSVQNEQCTTSPSGTTFLDATPGYIYACNRTFYQVTRLNIQRSEHNDMYMCTTVVNSTEERRSNWIIKVKAKITSVKLTPSNNQVNVTENTAEEFKCRSSTARPAASVYWYIHSNENNNVVTITENITTTTDYNDLSVLTSTLNFVPTRQHNDMKIYCEANNSVNTSPVKSNKILLNVQYKAEPSYIVQGTEYRVIDNKQGTLSCTVRGGNPTPTLSWSCNKFSPISQSTINYNGNVTTTLTWNVSRTHEGKCTCTPQQKGFIHEAVVVSLVVLYEANVTSFTIDGFSSNTVTKNESDPVHFNCNADSNPKANMTLGHDNKSLKTTLSNNLKHNISQTSCLDAGKYMCTAKNMFNKENCVSKEVQLFVNCYPRTENNIQKNITSEINATITITLKVIAYPPPIFTWYKMVDEEWTLLNDDNNYSINSSAVQSNLTIRSVGANDFISYKVHTKNEFGEMNQHYYLSPYVPAIETSSNSPGALIGGLTGGISGVVIIVIVIIVVIRRYPLLKGRGNIDKDIRRPDSDDSNGEDGLVDNPMYASSSNVAPVASTSASTSTDIYAKPVTPKKQIVPADVYENFELDNKPKKKQDGKQPSPGEPASKEPKLKIVNKDGLIYADLLYNGKPPGEKMVIIGDDPTPYAQVDFTKKADPLPESDEEDENK